MSPVVPYTLPGSVVGTQVTQDWNPVPGELTVNSGREDTHTDTYPISAMSSFMILTLAWQSHV